MIFVLKGCCLKKHAPDFKEQNTNVFSYLFFQEHLKILTALEKMIFGAAKRSS